MTPTPHEGYTVGVPEAGSWKEIFNSDDEKFWGSGMSNLKAVKSEKKPWHGRDNHLDKHYAAAVIGSGFQTG